MSDTHIKEEGEINVINDIDVEEEGEVPDPTSKKLNMSDLNCIDGNMIYRVCKMYHIMQKARQPDVELEYCVRIHDVLHQSIREKFNDIVLCLNLKCDKSCGRQHLHVPHSLSITEMYGAWKYELKEMQTELKYADQILNPSYVKPPDYEANDGFMKSVSMQYKFTYDTYIPKATLIKRYKALRKEYLDRQINIAINQKKVFVLEISKIKVAIEQCIKMGNMVRVREMIQCAEYLQKNITIIELFIKLARKYSRKLRNNKDIDSRLDYFERNSKGEYSIGICHKDNLGGWMD